MTRSINSGRAMMAAPTATANRAPMPAYVAMRASGMPAITVDTGRLERRSPAESSNTSVRASNTRSTTSEVIAPVSRTCPRVEMA